MSARRDPSRRVPPGGGMVLATGVTLLFWAGLALALWLLASDAEISVTSQEVSHADQ